MASYFRKARNVEISTFEYIRDQINASWSNVNIVKSFTQAYDKDLPVICVRLEDIDATRLEIGSTTLDETYGIIIDIFARSDGQRLDLADFILNQIKNPWSYYNYSHVSGDKTSLTKTADGKISLYRLLANRRVTIPGSPEQKDKYRHLISILVKKY